MTGPVRRAGVGWFTLFTLAWLVLWAVQLTPLQLLLPLQLDTPDDADGWIGGVVSSGIVLGIGGLAAIVAGPLAGAWSDRTVSRFGRRRPWALGGTLVGAGALVATAFAEGPWAVGAGWVGVSVGVAVASSALTAMIADRLSAQRGAASAVVGASQAVGIVVGVGLVVLLGLGVVDGYLVLAALLAVVGVTTSLLLPDAPALTPLDAARPRSRALRDRDFLWLIGGRLAVNIGNALGTGLLLFYLLYGLGSAPATAEDDLLLLILVYTVFVVAASILGGRLSDRTGRRKGIVVGAALVQAASAVLIALVPDYAATMVAAALLGAGYGAFMSVGLAFATDLLPGDADHGRDLGVVNVSANLGQLLGPLVGAVLVAAVGGFWLMFAVAALASVVGAVMTAVVRMPPPPSPRPDPAPR